MNKKNIHGAFRYISLSQLLTSITERQNITVHKNRALIVDYKNSTLLQRYIGLGGKILSRKYTMLPAKQQRLVAKTIKCARVMGLLPFVRKENL